MTTSAERTHTVKGPGLARGPAMIIGTILSVAGLALFLHAGDTSTAGFPDGDATGSKILGFESNGWTAWITTAAGALLLFGAAQHLLAKAVSAIVGIVLAACAVIALIDGDVLGLAAANWAVELAWGIAAVILLLNLLAPRVTHDEPVRDGDRHDRTASRDGDDRTVVRDHDRTVDGHDHDPTVDDHDRTVTHDGQARTRTADHEGGLRDPAPTVEGADGTSRDGRLDLPPLAPTSSAERDR